VLQRVINRLTIALALARCRDRNATNAALERSFPAFTPAGKRFSDPWALRFDWSRLPYDYLRAPGSTEVLNGALDALPARHRAAALIDTEGLAIPNVAAGLGESAAAVRRRLHQARMSVREHLTSYFGAATARH
jgi:DNA-directed RNA polymerase specialized sigma24 family protein